LESFSRRVSGDRAGREDCDFQAEFSRRLVLAHDRICAKKLDDQLGDFLHASEKAALPAYHVLDHSLPFSGVHGILTRLDHDADDERVTGVFDHGPPATNDPVCASGSCL
jgi:hypothetical protein